MKILILALSGIGDALMFTPALKLMRSELPEAQIDVLTMFKGAEDILQNNPDVNNVFRFDFINEGISRSLKYIFSFRKKYDVSISVYPSNRKEYNVINFLVGAKKRAAVKYLRKDFAEFGFLNNIRVMEDDTVHNVQTNIKLVEKLLNKHFNEEPPLEIYFGEDDKKYAENFLNEIEISDNDLVAGFHPGCAILKNHIKRRWEPEKFAELGKKLIDERKAKILIFGGPDEKDLKETIRKKIGSSKVFILNADSILHSAAIMKRCNVFITNDSSQMHIASALQRKVVAIIGPTNTHYIHPWKTEHKIVSLNLDCAPCFFYSPHPLICSRDDVQFKCIKELTVDIVYSAVKDFLTNI